MIGKVIYGVDLTLAKLFLSPEMQGIEVSTMKICRALFRNLFWPKAVSALIPIATAKGNGSIGEMNR